MLESGEKLKDLTAIACPSIEWSLLFSATSKIVTTPSRAPQATWFPLQATLTVNLPFVWKTCSFFPVSMFHKFTFPDCPVDATNLPSGLKVTPHVSTDKVRMKTSDTNLILYRCLALIYHLQHSRFWRGCRVNWMQYLYC